MKMTAPKSNVIEKKYFDKIALIDADVIKHVVVYKVFQQLMQNYTREEIDIDNLIEEQLLRYHNSFSCKHMVFCFSGKSFNTFRYTVAIEKEYKGNRKLNDTKNYDGKIEDMAYVVTYIKKFNTVLLYKDLEADDLLSMLQSENTFIVSNDKDLNQIPGHHFDFGKLNLVHISEEEAIKNLAYQLIKGDTVDNIPGIAGLGDKRAVKILAECSAKNMMSRIFFEYQLKYGIVAGIDAFVENYNLLKLRMNRGTYFREKYHEAFLLIKNLLV